MKKYIALKDNLQRIFLSKKVIINNYRVKKRGIEFEITHYEGFVTVNVNDITIFYFFNKSKEKPFNDFIEITLNKRFSLNSIINGSIYKTNIVIEGADGVGKSTLVKKLAEKGFLTQDRAVKEVTQKMREEIPRHIRIDEVKKYLQKDQKRKLVFLYLSDEKVLQNRVNSRGELSEYDKKALIFQKLYIDTFEALKSINNIYLIDCLGKTPDDLVLEIEKMIK